MGQDSSFHHANVNIQLWNFLKKFFFFIYSTQFYCNVLVFIDLFIFTNIQFVHISILSVIFNFSIIQFFNYSIFQFFDHSIFQFCPFVYFYLILSIVFSFHFCPFIFFNFVHLFFFQFYPFLFIFFNFVQFAIFYPIFT